MQISVDLFMLHATGGHASTICMLAATWVQIICDWPPVACDFAVFELKNEDAI
jgi:hypothetical protein